MCLTDDFSIDEAREHWISRVTDAVATGYVDGAFIDGNRGGFSSGILGPCTTAKKAAWAAGLNESVAELARRLGPNATLISNYPTDEALALCSGGMMERGGAIKDVIAFGKKKCGLWNTPCLLDYHAQVSERLSSLVLTAAYISMFYPGVAFEREFCCLLEHDHDGCFADW